METYTELKNFCENPRFETQRDDSLRTLDFESIDLPIVDLVRGFSTLSCCFTLQSCYGHFLHGEQKDPRNTERIADSEKYGPVEYRIAYLAFCIEDCEAGRALFEKLRELQEIDPSYVQFGCAEWFWNRQKNSYVLQVEPERLRVRDSITVDHPEALHIQDVRDRFFSRMRELLSTINER
jgi:hypothetical protein